MQWFKVLIVLLTLTAALALPATALADGLLPDGSLPAGPLPDEIVLGGTFRLEDGETLDGNLLVLGGSAALDSGSRVAGDVFVAGGSLSVNGEVGGNVMTAGGSTRLESSALVRGDVSVVGGSLRRDPGAVIEGEVNDQPPVPYQFIVPGELGLDGPDIQMGVNPVWRGLMAFVWTVFRAFLWAGAAVLVVMFLPDHTRRVADAAVGQPLLAGGLGLVTVAAAPIVLIVLAITILLLPVSFAVLVVLAVLWAFGLIAIGTEVGRRLTAAAGQDWPPAVYAAIGMLVLTLLLNFFRYILCVGWLPAALVGVLGLGAVLLTRLGAQVYPPLSGHSGPPAPQLRAAEANDYPVYTEE